MFTEDKLRMTYGLPSQREVSQFVDLLQKGKAAPIGEVRTWSGQQYVKHADGWVHVHPTTGKVTVLPTSGSVRKLDGNDEHKSHFEKHFKPEEKSSFKEETPDANALPHSGPVIGQTSSSKNIYRGNQANEYKNFSKQDHLEAGGLHSYLAGREADKVDTKKAHQGLGSGSIPKTPMQEVHLKASSSHSYFAEHGVKNKEPLKEDQAKPSEPTDLDSNLPKTGDILAIKKDNDMPTSIANLGSQKLKVIGTIQTGLISQPTFLKVQDEAGKIHEINPNYLESHVSAKPDESKYYAAKLSLVGEHLNRTQNYSADAVEDLRSALKKTGKNLGKSNEEIDKDITKAKADHLTESTRKRTDSEKDAIKGQIDKSTGNYMSHKENFEIANSQNLGTYSHDMKVKNLSSLKEKSLNDLATKIAGHSAEHNLVIKTGLKEVDSLVDRKLLKQKLASDLADKAYQNAKIKNAFKNPLSTKNPVLGVTSSGKSIYTSHLKPNTKSKVISEYDNFTPRDHQDAQNMHNDVLSRAYKEKGDQMNTTINEYAHRASENFHRGRLH